LGYVNGKRKRKVIYGKTRKEVAEALKVVLRDKQLGMPVPVERQTVAQYLTRWLTDVAVPKVRLSTMQVYEETVERIVPHIGRVPLAKLTPQDVQRMLQEMAGAGAAPSSVARARAVLRNALGQALRWGLIPRNVAALTDAPPEERKVPKVLTPHDARALLEAARGERFEALYHVALALGLRQGELLGLRWQDVDLEAGTLRIEQTIKAVRNKLVIQSPKTRRSRRTLPLPPYVVEHLHRHRVRQLEEQLLAGKRWQEHDLVFASSVGTPIQPRNLLRAFHQLLAHAGLPRMRFHDLRHSCATLLAAQGVPPRVAMEILGHANISTTMNIYTQVLDDSTRQALFGMGTLLGAKEAS
jgi:integrase